MGRLRDWCLSNLGVVVLYYLSLVNVDVEPFYLLNNSFLGRCSVCIRELPESDCIAQTGKQKTGMADYWRIVKRHYPHIATRI
jgi:hypothetical protein